MPAELLPFLVYLFSKQQVDLQSVQVLAVKSRPETSLRSASGRT